MRTSIPAPVAIGVIVVVLVVGLGFAWSASTGNGESRNPNAGHPNKSAVFGGLSRQAGDTMTEDTYYKFLKQNRPDLSESELRAKADNWWRIKSGPAGH